MWPNAFMTGLADQFEHVAWTGLHFFDVIWTLFMFMVGVSLSFSLAGRKKRGKSYPYDCVSRNQTRPYPVYPGDDCTR